MEAPMDETSESDVPKYCCHDLQFYSSADRGEMDVEELERITIDRITMLAFASQIIARDEGKTSDELRKLLVSSLREKGLSDFADLCDGNGCRDHTAKRLRVRKMDFISHSVSRLIFGSIDKPREWFRTMELCLFEWRLQALDAEGIRSFKTINKLEYPAVTKEEKDGLKDRIAPLMKDPSSFDATQFYKVPVLEVLELAQTKEIYFEKGLAYIIDEQFRSLFRHHFEIRLRTQLKDSIGALYYIDCDQRIGNLARDVMKIYRTVKEQTENSDALTVERMKELIPSCFPPCMRTLEEGLNATNHLRNGGRVQYSLFLRSIGMSGRQAIPYYQKIFTKKITHETFNKEYIYQFRHLFGLVGSKKDYGCFRCRDIVSESSLGPLDFHGCTFATEDIEELGKKLRNWEIPFIRRNGIIESVKNNQWSKACCEYFEGVHDCPPSKPIARPSDFYRESRAVLQSKSDDPFEGDTADPEGWN